MPYSTTFFAAGLLLAAGALARADEFALKLKDGRGSEVTQSNCSACHSIDYVLMNSPFQSKTSWDAEVHKMIKTYGAEISEADAQTIIDYLSTNYGG